MADEAPPAPPTQEPPEKRGIDRKCQHCGKMGPLGHIAHCEKNPKRRVAKPRDHKAERAARKAREAEKAGKKPPAKKPEPKPASKQDAFLARERKSLQAEAAPPAAAPPAADKPKKKGSSWALMVVGGLGLLWLLYLFFTAPDPGKPPRERRAEQEAPPALKANAHVPGMGSFHVPGLREA